MDDFLYVLLLVAWLGFSLYNRSQKRKARQTASAPETTSEKSSQVSFEQLLSDTLGIKMGSVEDDFTHTGLESPLQTGEVYSDRKTTSEKPLKGKYISPFLNYELSQYRRGESAEEISENEIRDAGAKWHKPGFEFLDLKKAIIYSEILNPPYIVAFRTENERLG